MKVWILAFCLIALSLFAHSQGECTCSPQITQLQMQSQLNQDFLNAKINDQGKNFSVSLDKAKIDIKAMMDEDFSQHDKYMIEENNRVIDQVLLRVVVALFATAGFGISLVMVLIYWRL
jgi:hypothetical protein